jgi:hypothetical protein
MTRRGKAEIERGLIARPRYLQLERSGTGLEGQAAETSANIAKSRKAIAEQCSRWRNWTMSA